MEETCEVGSALFWSVVSRVLKEMTGEGNTSDIYPHCVGIAI